MLIIAILYLSYFFYMHYHELSVSIIKTFHKRNFIVENKKLCLVYVLYNLFDNIIILVTSKKLKNEYLKTCYHSN